MANLKEIRIRIASVRSTQKITSAMKMVSAAKLRRAQTAIFRLRPFADKLNGILSNITTAEESENNPLSVVRPVENVVIILIASNKGLCGGFNNAVIKECESLLRRQYSQLHRDKKVQFVGVGKRISDYLKARKYPVLGYYDDFTSSPSFETIADLAENLMSKFTHKEADKVVIIYNEFKNAATQILKNEQYLPILPTEMEDGKKNNNDYLFEPDKAEMYKMLIPKVMKTKLYKIVLDSIASEHGARMTAMHKATENADELIKDLNLTYNKVRQSSITNEIIEIVSGAEALNS